MVAGGLVIVGVGIGLYWELQKNGEGAFSIRTKGICSYDSDLNTGAMGGVNRKPMSTTPRAHRAPYSGNDTVVAPDLDSRLRWSVITWATAGMWVRVIRSWKLATVRD